MIRLQEDEMVTLPGYNNPPKKEMAEEQYMCHKHCLKEKKIADDLKMRQDVARKRKEDDQKRDILKKVFTVESGKQPKSEYDPVLAKTKGNPLDGIVLHKRPDYTVPKDKWKLGNQLKELRSQF